MRHSDWVRGMAIAGLSIATELRVGRNGGRSGHPSPFNGAT
jgi:hypothetical protein